MADPPVPRRMGRSGCRFSMKPTFGGRSRPFGAALFLTIVVVGCSTETELDRRARVMRARSEPSAEPARPAPAVFQEVVRALLHCLLQARQHPTALDQILVFDERRREIRLESSSGEVVRRFGIPRSIRLLNHPGRVFLHPDGTASWDGPDTTLWAPGAERITASDVTVRDRSSGWICAFDLDRREFRNLAFRTTPPD